MALDHIASQKDSIIASLNIWERKINPSGIFWNPENSGRYSSNSYIVYAQYEGKDAPNILLMESVKGIYTSGRDDWVGVSWRDTPFSAFQNKYCDTIEKIKETTKLRKNWNSYGALEISNVTATRAIEFLYKLFRVLNAADSVLPEPFVVACPDGGIQFEWEKRNKEIEVVIPHSEEEKISLLKVEGDDYQEALIDHPEEFSDYLIWLIHDEE